MKICDPLYGYIYFDETLQSFIEIPLFQRLRFIQQLGFSQYAFPSGVSNRFTHSLGCSYLAGQAFDTIFNKPSINLHPAKKQAFKKAIQIAALLHDIGHGPLSHSSECLMPELKNLDLPISIKRQTACHEDYSLKILMETEISDLLKKWGIETQAIAQLIHPEFVEFETWFEDKGISYLPLLKQIISSELDVDRMDYLHRDSISCGVRYGLIDFVWLLYHFDSYQKDHKMFLAIDSKTLYTIESFMLGRQHMRLIVYFHYKAVIYNEMLKKYAQSSKWVLPHKLEEYLKFTDSHLMNHLTEESLTNEWADRIIHRKPYIRFYEYNRINEEDLHKQQMFKNIKNKLSEHQIPYIEINSHKGSIKPSKLSKGYPIFLKDHLLNTAVEIFNTPNLFQVFSRQIDRIYIDSEYKKEAQKLLN